MSLHKQARLAPRGPSPFSPTHPPGTARPGVGVRTAYKWLKRFREEGKPGLMDRSSRPPLAAIEKIATHSASCPP